MLGFGMPAPALKSTLFPSTAVGQLIFERSAEADYCNRFHCLFKTGAGVPKSPPRKNYRKYFPLNSAIVKRMKPSLLTRHPALRDALSLLIFIVCVLVGTLFINTFIFRSFSVDGPSMENTLHTGDRLVVNRLAVTMAHVRGDTYIPKREQIIVFKNPNFDDVLGREEYVVKRVIAFPGERVTVKDGVVTVYNGEHPGGFNPDENIMEHGEPSLPTDGDVDTVVPDAALFVMGDNRVGSFSCDSRDCMGPIPLYDVVGPVGMRIYPFTKITGF